MRDHTIVPQRLRTPAGLSTSFHCYITFTYQWDQSKTDHEYSKNTQILRGFHNPTIDSMTYNRSIDDDISFDKALHGLLNLQMAVFPSVEVSHPYHYAVLSPKSTGFNEFISNIATALVCLATNRVYNFSKTIFDGMGEDSRTPTESHHTPTSEASQSSQHELPSPSLPPVPTESLPNVIPFDNPPLRQYTRRTRIAHDSTPRVTSLVADEGSMQQKLDELMALCTSLQRQQSEMVSSLQRQQSEMVSRFEAQELEINSLKARIKQLKDKDREEAAKRVSDDTKEMETVLTSMDATSILTSAGVQVVPTAAEVATATIARDAEIARIHTEEELQMLIDGLDSNNETVAKYLQEYYQFATELPIERRIELISDLVRYQDHYPKTLKYQTQQRKPISRKLQKEFYMSVLKGHAGWKARHFTGMTLEEIKEKFDLVWKQFQDFIPLGSKEEAERFKRKGLRLEQESVKKLKTSEEVKATEEVLEEKVKEMMQLVPIEEEYVEALQVKHLIIDWKVHTEGQRSYWKNIRLGGSSASYQFFMDMLKHLDR
uniref:Uncharacterized protein n=1 Tax=Tanacetum cinerariifolium TaxID=118510 RepID=A0A6L2NXP5_TANCI|nr:hypothetical protein [Tanacetum cinerariifolium]